MATVTYTYTIYNSSKSTTIYLYVDDNIISNGIKAGSSYEYVSEKSAIEIKLINCYFDKNGNYKKSVIASLNSGGKLYIKPWYSVLLKSNNKSYGSVENSSTGIKDPEIAYLFEDAVINNDWVAEPKSVYRFINWTSDSGSASWYNETLSLLPDRNETWTANFEKIPDPVLTFNFNGCVEQTIPSVTYGGTLKLPVLKKSALKENIYYDISFVNNKTGKTEVLKSSAAKKTTTYDNYKWIFVSNAGRTGSYDPSYPVDNWTESGTFTASYSSDTEVTETTVGTLAEQSQITGYISKGWYDSSNWEVGTKISTNTRVSGNATFYAGYDGVNYVIKFKQLPTTGVEWDDNKPTQITKKYGTDTSEFPTAIPKRTGYEFVGWGIQGTDWRNPRYASLTPAEARAVKAGDWRNPDIVYAGMSSLSSKLDELSKGAGIELSTIWRPINKFITLNWYDEGDSSPLRTWKKYFTIEDIVVEVYSPGTYGQTSRSGDWAFYSWYDIKDDFETSRGSLRDITGKTMNLPYSLDATKTTSWTTGWDENTKSIDLYGYWAITGKYANVNGVWKKVIGVYVKQAGGNWTLMNGISGDPTSFSVCMSKDNWKKEV